MNKCVVCEIEFTPDKCHKNSKTCSKKCCAKMNYIANREKRKIKSNEYYHKNKDLIKKQRADSYDEEKSKANVLRVKIWREQNPEKYKLQNLNWKNENRDVRLSRNREWQSKNPEKILRYYKKYRTNNPDKIKESQKKYEKSNPIYRIGKSLRCSMRRLLIGKNKSERTQVLIGCSPDFLKQHLESLFTEGMTWENYGHKGWHVDHIRPCASFDLSDPEQQKECFHYTNLQPLWWYDNLSKSDKWDATSV